MHRCETVRLRNARRAALILDALYSFRSCARIDSTYERFPSGHYQSITVEGHGGLLPLFVFDDRRH